MLNLLSENSLLVSFGSMTGETMQISSGDLIFKQATVKGFWASVVNKEMPAARKKELIVELLTLATQKKLILPVEGVLVLMRLKLPLKEQRKVLVKAKYY